jgi:hypothetical protein
VRKDPVSQTLYLRLGESVLRGQGFARRAGSGLDLGGFMVVRTRSLREDGFWWAVRQTGGQSGELVGSQTNWCKSGEPVQASDDPLHRQHGGDEPH